MALTPKATRSATTNFRTRFLPAVLCLVALQALGDGFGAAQAQPLGDAISATVGATPGQSSISPMGAAGYTVPIYTAPGTAGVVPKLALDYSSQGNDGALGKGWAIGGTSAISRCRASREAGDYIVNGVPVDGDPDKVQFTASDKFCLDGQRLIPAPVTAAACAPVASMTVTQYRTEVESFQRVCGYLNSGDPTRGPIFFTVERKDGSTSWYGDRAASDSNAANARPDGIVAANNLVPSTYILTWAQTRFQDSTGNYIDYRYLSNPGNSASEQVLSEVRYTGKVVLPGQAGAELAPYARVTFNYVTKPTLDWSWGYFSGVRIYQTQQLSSIRVSDGANTLRYYALTYAKSESGSGVNILARLTECADEGMGSCFRPTQFDWSTAKNELGPIETPPDVNLSDYDNFEGYKLADVDGDGRQDMVWLNDGNTGQLCTTEYVTVAFGKVVNGANTFFKEPQTRICTPSEVSSGKDDLDGKRRWYLFDYDGDGRSDLFVAGPTGGTWKIYKSLGRPSGGVVFGADLLTVAIPRTTNIALTDFNGDGLLDVIYSGQSETTSTPLRVRMMENFGGAFRWGSERTVVFTSIVGTLQEQPKIGEMYAATGGFQLMDFNGDARSDLAIKAKVKISGTVFQDMYVCFTLRVEPTQVVIQAKNRFNISIGSGGGMLFWGERFADVNGDGLVDLIANYNTQGNLNYQLNNGRTFDGLSPIAQIGTIPSKYMQIADVNGDGRADVLAPPASNPATFNVFYSRGDGTFSAATPVPGGAALINCSDECENRFEYLFNDFDGDGALDFFRIKWVTGSGGTPDQRLGAARAGVSSRFKPRDTLIRITDGFGAVTQLTYLPMTVGDVYRRDNGSRANSASYGRGSAVQDLVAPVYVVAKHEVSSPTASNPSAMKAVYYRYAGAKLQAGGRGHLGMREVVQFDLSFPGATRATRALYAQKFPFVGSTEASEQIIVPGPYAPSSCFVDVTEGCYATPDLVFPALSGTRVSAETTVWEAAPAFSPSVQTPAITHVMGSQSDRFDLATGARMSSVSTAMLYDVWNNALQAAVDQYTGTSNVNPISTVVVNSFTNDEVRWRLGRTTNRTQTFTRDGQSVSRQTAYSYAMGGPVTGLLNSERIQPMGAPREDLRTEYDMDVFGNRTAAYICSQNIAACKSTATTVSPMDVSSVHRYTRTEYDAIGRFTTAAYEPFRANGSTIDSGARTEAAVTRVVARNKFGQPRQVQDVNGAWSQFGSDLMGRPNWQWKQTVSGAAPGVSADGVDTETSLRYCGAGSDQVSCPAGASYRQQVVTDGSPTQWAYFDVQSRTIASVTESFNAGITGKDFAATCRWYDLDGQVSAVSEPFFLADAGSAGQPSFASGNPCVQASRVVSRTDRDVLGRAVELTAPDTGVTLIAFNGLTVTTTDPRLYQRVESRNAANELTSVTDAVGLSTQYGYDPAGNLASVSRDAGRGPIVTLMQYDTLGRKIWVNDPDSGSRSFAYTPAGEVEAEWDSQGNRIDSRFDFRGRMVVRTSSTTAGTEQSSSWDYDLATFGRGRLAGTTTSGLYAAWAQMSGMATQKSEAFSYNDLGRLSGTVTTGGGSFQETTAYDALGRPAKQLDAAGKWAKTEYGPRGFVARVCESTEADSSPGCVGGSSSTYKEVLETDARGNVTSEKIGGSSAMLIQRQYDPQTGRMMALCAGSGGINCQIVNDRYEWDRSGNMTAREKTAYREEFDYDAINRLTNGYFRRIAGTSYVDSARPTSAWVSLDKLGNVCGKRVLGVGHAFVYHGRAGCGLNGVYGMVDSDMTASPHQVISDATINVSYTYDAAGNQTFADSTNASEDRTVRYTADSKPYEAYLAGKPSPISRKRFWYGADGEVYKRQDKVSSGISGNLGDETTWYVGNVEIILKAAGNLVYRRQVAGVLSQEIVPFIDSERVTNSYLFVDFLGSIVAVTDATGAVTEALDYSPSGERRNAADPRLATSTGSSATSRGFTGHRMADGLSIVHMRGRIYDPTLGRFLQADPVVQDASNPQNFNRYTYVWNNPLAYTDPTGNQSVRRALRQFAGLLIAAYLPGSTGIFGSAANGVFAHAAGGFLGGLVATGNIKTGLATAFTSGTAIAISEYRAEVEAESTAQTGGKFASGDDQGEVLSNGRTVFDGDIIYPEDLPRDMQAYDKLKMPGILAGSAQRYQLLANRDGIPYFYNKSREFAADAWEVTVQKYFGRNDRLARRLSELVAHVDHPITFYLDSQATVIGKNAALYFGLPRGSTLDMWSPAVSTITAQRAAASIDGFLVYRQPTWDGANLWSPSLNPLNVLSGVRDLLCSFCVHSGNARAFEAYK